LCKKYKKNKKGFKVKIIKKTKYNIDIKEGKLDSECVLDNGNSIWINKSKKSYYLNISNVDNIFVSNNIYELISFAIVVDDIYKDCGGSIKKRMYNERIYLYEAAKRKGMLKDKNRMEIDYKIIKKLPTDSEIKEKRKIIPYYESVEEGMRIMENQIIQVCFKEEENKYLNRAVIDDYNDFINKIKREDSEIYIWEKDWLKDLSLIQSVDEINHIYDSTSLNEIYKKTKAIYTTKEEQIKRTDELLSIPKEKVFQKLVENIKRGKDYFNQKTYMYFVKNKSYLYCDSIEKITIGKDTHYEIKTIRMKLNKSLLEIFLLQLYFSNGSKEVLSNTSLKNQLFSKMKILLKDEVEKLISLMKENYDIKNTPTSKLSI
jgi:hypothetical protein